MYNLKILGRSTFGNGTGHKELAQITLTLVPQTGSIIVVDGLSCIVKNVQYNITKNALSYDSVREDSKIFLQEKKQDVLNEVVIYCDIC